MWVGWKSTVKALKTPLRKGHPGFSLKLRTRGPAPGMEKRAGRCGVHVAPLQGRRPSWSAGDRQSERQDTPGSGPGAEQTSLKASPPVSLLLSREKVARSAG